MASILCFGHVLIRLWSKFEDDHIIGHEEGDVLVYMW